MTKSLTDAIQIVLGAGLLGLVLLSTNLLFLTLVRISVQRREIPLRALRDDALPVVLVQLPLYNEGRLVERLLQAVAALDWPRDRLRVQVLDDSTDGSVEYSKRAVRAQQRMGLRVELLQRRQRTGFKAGALSAGLAHNADADFVAILDADFAPHSDFLRRLVPVLEADSRLAFAQARWTHSNRHSSLLTRVQALLLDAHFRVEQEARWRLGIPLAFNGTCGVWRREAITAAGGWQGDTLSEDLDLSIRAHLAGWHAAYLVDVGVSGELPESARAWRSQQYRWSKGHAQCAVKLLPRLWRSQWPLWHKLLVTLQVSQSLFFPIGFVCLMLSLPLLAMETGFHLMLVIVGLTTTSLGFASTAGFLAIGQLASAAPPLRTLFPLTLTAMALTSGLLLSNTRAVLGALAGHPSEFVRTPKSVAAGRAAVTRRWVGLGELTVGVGLLGFLFLMVEHKWSGAFMTFVISGLLTFGLMQLLDGLRGVPAARMNR